VDVSILLKRKAKSRSKRRLKIMLIDKNNKIIIATAPFLRTTLKEYLRDRPTNQITQDSCHSYLILMTNTSKNLCKKQYNKDSLSLMNLHSKMVPYTKDTS